MLEINKIHNMDCLKGLKLLEDDSVDSIVTDPPYGIEFMGKEWDSFSNNTNSALGGQSPANVNNKVFPKRGKPISGWCEKDREAKYNYQDFSEQWAKECLRVLKPGGFLLAFSSPRMYHRMVCGIEDAGFEIRDQIMWLYGSGFPKSYNISKGFDRQGEKTDLFDIVRDFLKNALDQSKLTLKEVNERMGYATNGSGMAGHWFANITQQTLPTKEQWFKLKEILTFSDELDEIFNRCVTPYDRPVIGKLENPASSIYGSNMKTKDVDITVSYCDLAIQWDGWGTALKPANEPIVVARKPLSEKTVADNVIKWGTGGINIDDCRIGNEIIKNAPPSYRGKTGEFVNQNKNFTKGKIEYNVGRFPANIIFDEEAATLLDEQSGISKSKKSMRGVGYTDSNIYGTGDGDFDTERGYNDLGGASRFFYCAKASKKERGEGNNHPTVKPLSLIKYLVILVTPSGGISLDPFEGSGTHAKACKELGFNYIGFELSEEYIKIAEDRLVK